jgi:hypothetical protein
LALKDAMNTRMAKEGEVSILRKSIEKVFITPWTIKVPG